MSAKLGLSAKLYRLPTGTRATWGSVDATTGVNQGAAPTGLDEVPNVKDLSLNLEKSEAEVSTRGNNGWRARLSALKDGGIEFGMVYDSADTDVLAFLTAWLKGTPIALAILDGDKATAGTMGLWADFEVFNFTKTENLEEGQMVTVSVKPTYSAVPPEWVKVTS